VKSATSAERAEAARQSIEGYLADPARPKYHFTIDGEGFPGDSNGAFYSCGVATHETMGFRYGYMEMRAWVPFRHGAWPSWWMTATSGLRKCDWMSEIDSPHRRVAFEIQGHSSYPH